CSFSRRAQKSSSEQPPPALRRCSMLFFENGISTLAYKSFSYWTSGRKTPTGWSFSSHTSILSFSPLSLARSAGSRINFPIVSYLNKTWRHSRPNDEEALLYYLNPRQKGGKVTRTLTSAGRPASRG